MSRSNKLMQTLSVIESAYTSLGETARLVLATAATTRMDRRHPIAMILIGEASSGKTSLLMPLTKGAKDSVLRESTIRLDDFTPASLVSHSANKKTEDLAKIDLLPKLDGKCVVLKEMAPVFSGGEDELLRKFGIFASVLDGEGYISSSGSHGQRGYTQKITFSLLGAVTPQVLTQKVHSSLTAIGPRFCFWEMPERHIDPKKWIGPSESRQQLESHAEESVINFLEDLFVEIPAGSIKRDAFKISSQCHTHLSAIAVLMAILRSKGTVEKDEDGKQISMSYSKESPERAFRYLEQLVCGSALVDGRFDITGDDLKLCLGVAISSGNPSIRKTARLFFEADFPRTVQDIHVNLGLSTDTARSYAERLQALGVVRKANDSGTTSWDLCSPFLELRTLAPASPLRPASILGQ